MAAANAQAAWDQHAATSAPRDGVVVGRRVDGRAAGNLRLSPSQGRSRNSRDRWHPSDAALNGCADVLDSALRSGSLADGRRTISLQLAPYCAEHVRGITADSR